MLFAGIGDARNLFRTLIDVADHERRLDSPKRDYHFTIIDINKCTITRNLIVLILLDELAGHDEGSDEALALLSTLYYVFIAPLIPRYAFRRLHEIISRALAALKAGTQPLRFVYCHINDMAKYIEVSSAISAGIALAQTTPSGFQSLLFWLTIGYW